MLRRVHVSLFFDDVPEILYRIIRQVLAQNSGPIAWSAGCSGIAYPPGFHSVGCTTSSFGHFSVIFSFVSLSGMYFSLQHLPLSDATVITFIAPILTGFSGAIFLKEPFSLKQLFSGCRCYLSSCSGRY